MEWPHHTVMTMQTQAQPQTHFSHMTEQPMRLALRIFSLWGAAVAVLFVLNNFLIFWAGWPGPLAFIAQFLGGSWLHGRAATLGWIQILLNLMPLVVLAFWAARTQGRSLRADADLLSWLAAYIVRSAFWAVLLIGFIDSTISFLRVENMLPALIGTDLTDQLGRASFRGVYVHYPIIALSFVIGLFTRTLGFTWLAVLIIFAEFQIVISRFIFSYEQAFMGDLVRFWYAALFLFASAYTLVEEGHVRVDILYNGFSERGKAWSNTIGTLVLGVPVCWVIMTQGMWTKSNLINAPMLSYEVTQSGYGMYVKYLMAGFLIIYAVSMLVQFFGFFLDNAATLMRERPRPSHTDQPTEI